MDWAQISVGVLVVEQRYGHASDATSNGPIAARLAVAGFELVRTLPVWDNKIVDNVYVRVEHFLGALTASTRLPDALFALLATLPMRVPAGTNRKWLPGRVAGRPYTVREPQLQQLRG
jgi:hypothetical protein